MRMSLLDYDASSGFDSSFTIQCVDLTTFPHDCILLFLYCILFSILEAVFILNNLRIVGTHQRQEGLINQDFVLFQNNVIYAPIVFCNKISRKEVSLYSLIILVLVCIDTMIMLMPLHDNNIPSSLDASSTFQPIGLATIPHDGSRIFFLHICFVIFETVSILNNLSTVSAKIIVTSAYTRNEGLIDQDFVFFQNYVIYAPIIVCNISRKLLLIIQTMIMLIFSFDNFVTDDCSTQRHKLSLY